MRWHKNTFGGSDMEENKSCYSRDELARRLGVSRDSVIRAIQRGELKVFRFGRRVLIPKSELDRILKEAK
ncbi:MAG: DNA-binding protein [Acidobacteria bacterium]|nr:MAG: DNA-binding protein [Acidobacteriota bacterium]